jgi:hypothetical protein
VLDWIDNLPAMALFTHFIAAMLGCCVGILAAALCVAARGPQYRPGRELNEGRCSKGLRNKYPTTPRPAPPKGQGFSIRDIPKPDDWGLRK